MKTTEEWLSAYAKTHQHPTNRRIHKICVPAILFSVLGMFWSLSFGADLVWLNGATVLATFGLLFYARLGLGPFLTMFATLGVMLGCIFSLSQVYSGMLVIYVAIFVIGWIGQFIGHHIEKQKPSFFEDLQFLLIGPLWTLYR